MTDGIRPDGEIFASEASDGELENFPSINRGWGVTLDGNDENGDSVTTATNGVPPMEWDNGQRNKVDNNIWWLMQHAIPDWMEGVWSAGAFVRYNSWVYFNSSETATSLSPQEGPEWKTVLPLDEAEGYLQIKNNFSEIAAQGIDAQGEARGNIGCGTAAAADLTEGILDTTPGRVTKVGDFGFGTTSGVPLLTSIFDITCTSTYSALGAANSSPAEGMPDNSGDSRFGILAESIYTNQYWVLLFSRDQFYVGLVRTDTKEVTWCQIYSQNFKPTAADTGAVAKTGDSMTGILTMNVDGGAIKLKPKTADYSSYIFGVDSANASSWYVGVGSANNADVVLNNYKGGNNNLILRTDGSITIAATNSKNVNITGQAIPSNYANFDGRYVAGVQLGAEVSYARSGEDFTYRAGAGSVMTGVNIGSEGGEEDEFRNIYSKPVQRKIAGVWATIGG
ncbi:hypothetical protein MUU49_14985 [Scandinavium goeteborgense]|uniref:hypothetical protein n=1 Tax=Scandinavium goeteborgense TaxID=1851514 RepID=UPI002166629B|nr:hypothetical protein [Scandinavium goeteborgense]MCS2153858.1 hypothetical protein [Scandinavium goeteborgense]